MLNNTCKRITCVIITIVSVVCMSNAAQIGGQSGAYLRGAAGASALSMGGAWSAQPQYLASWWNPSVIVLDKGKNIAAGTGLRSLGRTEAFGAYHFKIPPRVGMGIAVVYRGDPFLNEIYDPDEKIIGDARYTTFTTKIGLSYLLTKKMSVGAGLGILYQSSPAASYEDKIAYANASSIGAIDLAATYKARPNWTVALIARYLGTTLEWGGEDGFGAMVSESPLVPVTVASNYRSKLLGRPFNWNIDLIGYAFDAQLQVLDHTELFVNNGVEWHYWDDFYLRAGVGELPLNRNIVAHPDRYGEEFSVRLSGGISWDASSVAKGVRVNYGFSTDKVWAGIDQQLDITLSF